MASQPTPEQIREVIDFTSVSEREAAILLKKNQYDLQRAVEAWFNDPATAAEENWDTPMDNVPSFAIDVDDTSTGARPSMSRPNSRADLHRGEIQDLSLEHTQATANVHQGSADLNRAIQLSLQSNARSGQEEGLVGAGQHFGPATRSYYEADQWAMTVPVSSHHEIIEHPPPSKRRRLDGEPAFLYGSQETGYLAPLLTIYHGIPRAREALLLSSMQVEKYPHSKQWWAGQGDNNSSNNNNNTSITLAGEGHVDPARLSLLAEIQCLMAFLDKTDRSYGSVDELAQLPALKSYRADSSFSQLLEAWTEAAVGQCGLDHLSSVFSSTAVKAGEGTTISKDMVCLEPVVDRLTDHTIVNLLDKTVWNDSLENLDDIWFHHCAEVFTIRMWDAQGREEALKIRTSPVWYSDRYLEERKAESLAIRMQAQVINKQMRALTTLQNRFQFVSVPGRNAVRVKEVLKAVPEAAKAAVTDRFINSNTTSQVNGQEIGHLGRDVSAIMDRVQEKLTMIEKAKDELRVKMNRVIHKLTTPTSEGDAPVHKYFLMGVSTKPWITYLRRRNTDLLGMDAADGSSPHEWQWWRTTWSGDYTSAPVIGPVAKEEAEGRHSRGTLHTVTKVSESEVLDAIQSEHDSVVLVYALEQAIEHKDASLPQGLADFVAEDNREFARELRDELNPDEAQTPEIPDTGAWADRPLEDSPTGRRLAHKLAPMSIHSPQGQGEVEMNQQRSHQRYSESLDGQRSSDDEDEDEDDDEDEDQDGDDDPPPYNEIDHRPEMQERNSKIGFHAEEMLHRYERGQPEVKAEDMEQAKGGECR